MAKQTIKHDIYNVLDENGNVIYTLRYPEGSSMYEEARKARENGEIYQVYESSKYDTEDWAPVSTAKADITLDPVRGKVVLRGPSWLTNEIKNSDAFKQTYLESSSLNSLLKSYRADPYSSISLKDGTTMTVSEALSEYAKAADDSFANYANNVVLRDRIKAKFGVELNDTQLSIATSGQRKDSASYDKNAAIKVPKDEEFRKYLTWAGATWDPETETMRAEDFFNTVYKIDKSGEIENIFEIREYINSYLEDALAKNMYDRSDEEIAKIREQQLSDEDYKTNLASMLALQKYTNENKPDALGRYQVLSWLSGFMMKFSEGASNAGQNITEGVIESFESGMSLSGITETNTLDDAGLVLPLMLLPNNAASFYNAVVVGTFSAMVESGQFNPVDVYLDFIDEAEEIASEKQTDPGAIRASEVIHRMHKEAHENFVGINTELEMVGGDAFASGEFFGNAVYKIVENIVLLNTLGGGVGSAAVDIAGSIPGLSAFITMYAPKAAPAIINFVANVGSQAVFETYIDDKQLIDDAIASGNVDEGAWDKLKENFLWNAIGEGIPHIGKGLKAVAVTTTPGKVLDMAITKALNRGSLKITKAKYKFFSWLNKIETDSGGGVVAKGAKQSTSQYMTEYYAAKIKAQEALRTVPILKEMTADQQQAVKDGIAFIMTGRTFGAAVTDENVASEIVEDMFKNADTLKSGVGQNYEYFQKSLLGRINLENQMDAIVRGDKAKLAEMNAATGKAADDFSNDMATALEIEKRVQKATGKLTPRKSGAFFTKESSEYMSYSAQYGRYARLTGADGGTPILTGKKLKEAQKYFEHINKRLEELRGVLGKDLTDQLDIFRHSASRYYAALQNYMVKHGYVTKEYADLVKKLRGADAGWGENGIEYIPTMRTMGEADTNYNVDKFLDSITEDNLRAGKTISDDLKEYKMGSEDSFMDPAMVIYAHSRMMAKVAQGQDVWRALQGNNIMARAVKGFGADGMPEYETNLIQNGAKKLRAQLKQTLSASGKDFPGVIKNAVSESTVFKSAVRSKVLAGARSKAGKALDAHITPPFRAKLLSGVSDSDLTAVLSYAPKGVEVPNFSLDGVNAAGFKEWYGSLPKEVQSTLESRLGGQAANITNVRKLFKEYPDVQTAMKRAYLNSEAGAKVWDAQENKLFIRGRAANEFKNSGNTVAKKHAENYLKACEKLSGTKFDLADPSTFNADFSADMRELAQTILYGGDGQKGLIALLKEDGGTAATFSHMVDKLVESGVVSRDQAEAYCALLLAKDIKAKDIAAMLKSTDGKEVSLQAKMLKDAGMKAGDDGAEQITDSIAGGLRSELETMLNESQRLLKEAGAGDLMDLDTYWKTQENYQNLLLEENEAYKYLGTNDQKILDRHIVQAVGKDGKVQTYVTDPNTAFLVNNRPTYSRGAETRMGDFFLTVNDEVNQIFRAGTTGFDKVSYISQWFKDSINATIVGGALPFTDLGVGKSGFAAVASDYIPFGQRLFGKHVTERISKEVVDTTYEATRRGLVAANGDAFVKSIEDNAAKGLTGEAAAEAKKRAIVEYQIQRSGYEAMPSGNIREAETYRTTGRAGKRTLQEARQEEFDVARARRTNSQFASDCSKMKQRLDNLLSEDISKGQWRETYLRKAVYTTQYKNAIEAGNTAQEAHMWASRYAMDATTNFGRPFPIGNRFMQHVPYLGAAINGSASFWRLMEIDPVGVMSRLTTGLILPYTAALTESLSDPQNLENYMNIPEYEKSDKMVLMYHGAKVTIPCPQELSGFLAPFRHMVEKAAGANDASWVSLIASDALGIFPLDLSGFVDLDASTLLAEDQEVSLGSRIGRGVEKAAASLMPPVTKSVYMGIFGRDPYTGKEIDKSYTTLDDEGNAVIMDSNQSEIAQMMHDIPWFKNLSASACQKILTTLMGRSTLSVLDSAAEIFIGAVDDTGEYQKLTPGEWIQSRADETGEQVLSPVGASSPVYDPALGEWNRTVSALYEKRDQLTQDEAFMAAYRTLQNSGASEEKKEGALRTYRERLDVYEKEVLDAAIALKKKYPDAYTSTNQAKIISLLTLPTGLTYNETAYGQQIRDEAYYDARDAAVATYSKMGFPDDYEGTTLLGRGYYDSNGAYQFKIFTPYEIQFINSGVFGAANEFQAQVDQAMEAANITAQDKWNVYYSASTKAERKQLMSQWNKRVAPVLAPIIEKYGVEAVLGNSNTRDKISKYIYVSNPYKQKEFLYELFGGNQ